MFHEEGRAEMWESLGERFNYSKRLDRAVTLYGNGRKEEAGKAAGKLGFDVINDATMAFGGARMGISLTQAGLRTTGNFLNKVAPRLNPGNYSWTARPTFGSGLSFPEYVGPKGIGPYARVGGHHIHAKAAFRESAAYSADDAISISQDFMAQNGIRHSPLVTSAQRRLFTELAESGAANTMRAHNRIAVQALIEGGATETLARSLVARSLLQLRKAGVRAPSRIPWN